MIFYLQDVGHENTWKHEASRIYNFRSCSLETLFSMEVHLVSQPPLCHTVSGSMLIGTVSSNTVGHDLCLTGGSSTIDDGVLPTSRWNDVHFLHCRDIKLHEWIVIWPFICAYLIPKRSDFLWQQTTMPHGIIRTEKTVQQIHGIPNCTGSRHGGPLGGAVFLVTCDVIVSVDHVDLWNNGYPVELVNFGKGHFPSVNTK